MNKDDNVIDLSSSNNDNDNDNTMNYKTNISDNNNIQNQTESDVKVIQSFEIENEDNNNNNINQYNYDELVYGNHISISKPQQLGKLKCFLYLNGQPLIVLGRDKRKSPSYFHITQQ